MAKIWNDKYIEIDGVKAHYIEAGEGEPLVLIHGGGAASCGESGYGDTMPYLSKHFRVIAPDVIGFGLTPGRGPQDYTGKSQGDFLIKLLEALQLKDISLGGHSHGGFLVSYIAHERPKLVKNLIMINSLNGTTPIPPEPEGLKYIYGPKGHPNPIPTIENTRNNLLEGTFNKHLVTDKKVKRTYEILKLNHEYARERKIATSSTIEQTNKNLSYNGKHISESCHKFNMPILMTWSRENKGADLNDAVRYFERLKDAELHILVDAKHSIQRDQSKRWSEVVIEFLKARE